MNHAPVMESESAGLGRFLVIQIEEQHPRRIEVNLNVFEKLNERVPAP